MRAERVLSLHQPYKLGSNIKSRLLSMYLSLNLNAQCHCLLPLFWISTSCLYQIPTPAAALKNNILLPKRHDGTSPTRRIRRNRPIRHPDINQWLHWLHVPISQQPVKFRHGNEVHETRIEVSPTT